MIVGRGEVWTGRLLLIVLMVKPTGLFGSREVARV